MTARPARRFCSVAITGAGSDLGREIALAFAAHGCIVFGTAACAQEAAEVRSASGGRVSLAVCDIANADAAQAWAGGVADALDGTGLDILINNARLAAPGPLEILPPAAVRHAFDVNLFGALTVINAFLPALRRAGGRIIQISSWTAAIPLAFDGVLAASMAAMEAIALAYRAELAPFGIDVVIAPVGRPNSDVTLSSACATLAERMTSEQRQRYGRRLGVRMERGNGEQARGGDAAEVAARLIAIAKQAEGPCRVLLDREAEHMLRLVHASSDAELDALRLDLAELSGSSFQDPPIWEGSGR